MRVKLSLGNSDFIGFKNVNPFTELKELHDNSVNEIYLDQEVLSKILNSESKNFIQTLLSKLRRGGNIIITGPDCRHCFLAYSQGRLDEEKLSDLLGESRGFYNCKFIENILISLNIKIESMSISNYYFHIKGTRS